MRRCSCKALAGVAAAATAVGGLALPASAATFSASAPHYTAGGALHDGVYYAKSGSTLTLSVTTDAAARCVGVSDVSPIQTSTATKTSWTFSVAAVATGVADGVQSKTVTIGEDHSTDNKTGAVKECKKGVATASAPYTLDNTQPGLSGAATTGPTGNNGWYTGDVTIAWTAADTGSGVSADPASSTIASEGEGLTATTSVSDRVGNSRTATSSPAVKIDRTPPLTTPAAPVSTDWSNDDQTVVLTASDNRSGVAATYYQVNGGNPQSGTTVVISDEGTHALQYWSVDNAGNVEETQNATIKIDKTDPAIEHAKSPLPNDAGWNKGDVTVTFHCGDTGGSGISSCTGVTEAGNVGVLVTEEVRNGVVTGTAVDNAGNSSDDPAPVSLDKTEPSISAVLTRSTDRNGWYSSDVGVNLTYSDNLSGIKTNGVGSFIFGEGADQRLSVSATDNADNAQTGGVSGVNVDTTPPTTTSDAPSGWQQGDVTVALTATDQRALSGVEYTEYKVNEGDWTRGVSIPLTGDGVYNLQFRSADVAGNREELRFATVSIDSTGPTVVDGGPTTQPNRHGWYGAAVINAFAASDATSGLADAGQAAFTVSSGATQGATVQIDSGPVADVAGNSNPGIKSRDLAIDLTPPDQPTFSGISADEYVSGSVPLPQAISCTAVDALSTLDTCTVTDYGTTVGEHTLTATATDKAGNTSVATLTYSVVEPPVTAVWTHDGFHNPIGKSNTIVQAPDSAGHVTLAPGATGSTVWNVAKGGSTIPLKFNLKIDGVEQTSTASDVITKFSATKVTCPGGSPVTEAIEELASTGTATGLRYADAQYIQNWKTPSVTTDTCYRVALTTADNSAMYTFVRLRK